MTKLLYHIFPRQLAYPFRVTVDKSKFYQLINLLNGKKRIFSSVYNYTGNYEYDKIALVVDKVFFDFDGPESLPDALALTKECLNNDYKFTSFFSGYGFHIYVYTDSSVLRNPKIALSRFQSRFSGMDRSSIGDIARVATIPNTFNTKRGRFCIPVSLEDMEAGFEFCYEKARLQNDKIHFYGNSLVALSDLDCDAHEEVIKFDEPRLHIRKINDIPPCVNDILSYEKKGFRGRFFIINYLKDAGYLEHEIESIIREFCSEKEARHCIVDERQVNRLYWKDIMFPSCEQVKYEGKCPIQDFCEFTREYGEKHLVKIYK